MSIIFWRHFAAIKAANVTGGRQNTPTASLYLSASVLLSDLNTIFYEFVLPIPIIDGPHKCVGMQVVLYSTQCGSSL
jgi:hypothetical protein